MTSGKDSGGRMLRTASHNCEQDSSRQKAQQGRDKNTDETLRLRLPANSYASSHQILSTEAQEVGNL